MLFIVGNQRCKNHYYNESTPGSLIGSMVVCDRSNMTGVC